MSERTAAEYMAHGGDRADKLPRREHFEAGLPVPEPSMGRRFDEDAPEPQTQAAEAARATIQRLQAEEFLVGEYSLMAGIERDQRPTEERDKVYGRDVVDALDEYDGAIGRATSLGRLDSAHDERDERARLVDEVYLHLEYQLENSTLAQYTLQRDIHAQTGKTVEPKSYLAALDQDGFETLLRFHVERAEAQVAAARERLPELKATFSNNVTVLAAHQDWPISADDLDRRIDRAQVSFMDGLEPDRHMGAHGLFFPTANGVWVNVSSAELSGLHHTYNHEMLHAISGRELVVKSAGDDMPQLELNRFGMQVFDRTPAPASEATRNVGEVSEQEPVRYVWLNEAVTESATHQLAGADDYLTPARTAKIYELEQTLLSRLEQRVSRTVIMAAYFESHNPAGPPPQAWGRFQGEVAEAFDPNLLQTLDGMIGPDGATGLREAIGYMDVNYPGIRPQAKADGRIKHQIGKLRSRLRS